MEVITKTCPNCGMKRPLTKEYWHKNKSSKDGFAGWCKTCWNKRESQYRKDGRRSVNTHPGEDLSFQRFPKIDMELGCSYRVDMPVHGNGNKSKKFQGEVIQITERFIVLRHILGFNESFLKVDLAQLDFKEV